MTVRETVNAGKQRYGADDLDEVLAGVSKVVVAKGKKHTVFKLGKQAEHEPDELVKAVLGPTGNLRAPTVLVGKTALVGFNEEVWTEVLG